MNNSQTTNALELLADVRTMRVCPVDKCLDGNRLRCYDKTFVSCDLFREYKEAQQRREEYLRRRG